jgi:hypothetical protein
MGLNYVYVCSSPDEPPPPSSDDMSPGLPRVGALVRPEGMWVDACPCAR